MPFGNLLQNICSIEAKLAKGSYGLVYVVKDIDNVKKEYSSKIFYDEDKKELDIEK